jgi:hypothetical protein
MSKIQTKGRPVEGKQYLLMGGEGRPSIMQGNTWEESEIGRCPACGLAMEEPITTNALSRYCGLYICSSCGVREAFEGFFWGK